MRGGYTMTAIAFINSVFLSAWADEEPQSITEEDARCNIENWISDGVEVPEMLTPALLSTVWNIYCKK